jgi:ATP-binding cassette subfamily G (WHITE) protein 2 (PDR)
MASAGVWGSLAQSEGVAEAALKKVESQLSSTEKHDSESTDESSELPDKERADEEVFKLARQLTQNSVKTAGGTYQNPFENTDNPTLDPLSDHFQPEAWVRTLIG